MKNTLILLSLLSLSIFTACEKEDHQDILPEVPTELLTGSLNFSDWEIGDKFSYVMLSGEGYWDSNPSFEYTGDTLICEVIDKKENEFVVKESLSRNSSIFTAPEPYYYNADSIFINNWSVVEDELYIIPTGINNYFRSHLFYREYVPIALNEFVEEKIEINSWITDYNSTDFNKELYAEDFTLLGQSYDRLNVVVNNEAMAADGPGFTYIYSKDHGIVRTTTVSPWFGTGIGWDRLD